MDTDISYLLYCAGSVLVMVFFWTYYILEVRINPRSEEWYDELAWEGKDSDGVLFYYSYGTLFFRCSRCRRVGRKFNPRICLNRADVCGHGSSHPLLHWIHARDWGSASVAFCSALGRRHPQSKACSKG